MPNEIYFYRKCNFTNKVIDFVVLSLLIATVEFLIPTEGNADIVLISQNEYVSCFLSTVRWYDLLLFLISLMVCDYFNDSCHPSCSDTIHFFPFGLHLAI